MKIQSYNCSLIFLHDRNHDKLSQSRLKGELDRDEGWPGYWSAFPAFLLVENWNWLNINDRNFILMTVSWFDIFSMIINPWFFILTISVIKSTGSINMNSQKLMLLIIALINVSEAKNFLEKLFKNHINDARCFSRCRAVVPDDERERCINFCQMLIKNPEDDICALTSICNGGCREACADNDTHNLCQCVLDQLPIIMVFGNSKH